MSGRYFMSVTAALCLFQAAPAIAGRSIIDENPDGTRIVASLSGYCDFNGEDCYQDSGQVLPYKVSIGGSELTDRVIVQGNGLLTFGAPVDFFDSVLQDKINNGDSPSLAHYDRILISAGQSNALDYDGFGFLQSATLDVNSANGVITAGWFTCGRPTAPGICPKDNAYSLTLTPTKGGFFGHFDFSNGVPEGSDKGFVYAQKFTPTGDDFFLRASFQGMISAVPEPGTWVMMIAGFGLVGSAMRRRLAHSKRGHYEIYAVGALSAQRGSEMGELLAALDGSQIEGKAP